VTGEGVLLAFRAIDARTGCWFPQKRYSFELTDRDVNDANASFRAFPPLVEELSGGAAKLRTDVVMLEEPLTSLTEASSLLRFTYLATLCIK